MVNDGFLESLKWWLVKHEGKKYKRYPDTVGKWTIGVGHNIDANKFPECIADYEKAHGYITEEMVDFLFNADITGAMADCLKLYPSFKTFSDNRQIALIDFLFNVGIGTAKTFTNTNRCINSGDWESAAAHLKDSKWYGQVKGRGDDIVKLIRMG